jgi:hypothetical protein
MGKVLILISDDSHVTHCQRIIWYNFVLVTVFLKHGAEIGYLVELLVTGWMVQGLNPSRGKKFYFLQNCPDQLWDPPIFLFGGYQGSFPGVKQLGHEVDHLPPSSAKLMSEWSYTSAPHICLNEWTDTPFYFIFEAMRHVTQI